MDRNGCLKCVTDERVIDHYLSAADNTSIECVNLSPL